MPMLTMMSFRISNETDAGGKAFEYKSKTGLPNTKEGDNLSFGQGGPRGAQERRTWRTNSVRHIKLEQLCLFLDSTQGVSVGVR